MDTERTPEGRDQQPDKPGPTADKTNTHWVEWEIGCLLSQTAGGIALDDTSHTLRRTTAACKRMTARLLAGETPCPEQYQSVLDDVREKFPPEPKRRRSAKDADDRTVEQVKNLVNIAEAIGGCLDEICKIMIYRRAVDVIDGIISTDEIDFFFPGCSARTILAKASEIREFREVHEQPTADINKTPARDESEPSCPPPVSENVERG